MNWMCRVGDSPAFGRTNSMLLQLLLRPDRLLLLLLVVA
jgi:hypothetical protein